ncbi:MAG: hypothetical protein AB7F89_19040 [Pirellulaceae bacterium]
MPQRLLCSLLCSVVTNFTLLASWVPAQIPELPVVFREDFENGAKRWQPTDPRQWEVRTTSRGKVFSQHQKKSAYQPPHRSPFNVAIHEGPAVGDMVFDAHVLSTHEDYGHRDVCLVFGYQDPANFYYVHLGKKTDDHANQIFIVHNAPRTKISTQTTPGTNWDDQWHHVRIVRRAASGEIAVYFDDMKRPVMTATDKTFVSGRVGIGTFDDTSDWDELELRGLVANP